MKKKPPKPMVGAVAVWVSVVGVFASFDVNRDLEPEDALTVVLTDTGGIASPFFIVKVFPHRISQAAQAAVQHDQVRQAYSNFLFDNLGTKFYLPFPA